MEFFEKLKVESLLFLSIFLLVIGFIWESYLILFTVIFLSLFYAYKSGYISNVLKNKVKTFGKLDTEELKTFVEIIEDIRTKNISGKEALIKEILLKIKKFHYFVEQNVKFDKFTAKILLNRRIVFDVVLSESEQKFILVKKNLVGLTKFYHKSIIIILDNEDIENIDYYAEQLLEVDKDRVLVIITKGKQIEKKIKDETVYTGSGSF